MNIKRILTALSLGLSLFGSAHATLLSGKTVGFAYYKPDLGTSYAYSGAGNYVVGSGVEVANVVDYLATMDVSDSNLLIAILPPPRFAAATGNFLSAAFNGFVIYDALGTIDDFTSVTINAITNMAGFDSSRITFDANHIWVNWGGLSYTRGSTIVSLDINGTQQVPEPGTLALAGLALLAMVCRLRKTA